MFASKPIKFWQAEIMSAHHNNNSLHYPTLMLGVPKTEEEVLMANANHAPQVKGSVADIAVARQKRNSLSTKPAKAPSARRKVRPINEEKVEAIKLAIANGTYRINARRIADKFIEKESP